RVELNQFEAGEEVADFEGGGFRSVGAMSAIVADAGAEVVADGAGRGLLGIGGAHGVAPLKDGAFGFEDQDEDSAGAHEVGEFAICKSLFNSAAPQRLAQHQRYYPVLIPPHDRAASPIQTVPAPEIRAWHAKAPGLARTTREKRSTPCTS